MSSTTILHDFQRYTSPGYVFTVKALFVLKSPFAVISVSKIATCKQSMFQYMIMSGNLTTKKRGIMSNKDRHVLDFWWRKLCDLNNEKGAGVTAGELARSVGQSRNTAEKYLKRLKKENGASVTRIKRGSGGA